MILGAKISLLTASAQALGTILTRASCTALEPLSLLPRILVWDGADEVMPSAVLVDLARVPPDDDLVYQQRRPRSYWSDGVQLSATPDQS
jgi:hypothetical protein